MLDYNDKLEPCPICGKKAYVAHIYDAYDNADFGWDAGCPVAKRYDGIHGWDTLEELDTKTFPRVVCLLSKSDAIAAWNKWVKYWRERHDAL